MKKLLFPLIFLSFMISCEKKETLYLFNWAEYIPTHVFGQFEQENNVKLITEKEMQIINDKRSKEKNK